MQTLEKTLHIELLSNEQITEHVYLGDNEKNIELLNHFLKGGKEINKYLPLFTDRMALACMNVSRILSSENLNYFIFEPTIRKGYPFLALSGIGDKLVNISNANNWSNVNVGEIEASMILNALSFCYLCEVTDNETEQEFCIFMLDYLKRLADHNYTLKTENFDSGAFFRVID